ncbi:RAMP superfamily [Sulfidibacter corallicola]|uniref:CRISPR type III-associated protein domain-containing protein n=1 Tax=Sulfidibacter corallicola TaxID=2818388 RepID=A0A8A4TKN6_SULCO|nr:RAMP superfamily CRISPR-associated protein [Sulfidibacter corallicola]QTD49764.1 hypothetical protein J3U87_29625 [Sulfidibacter corallicola]
MFTDFQNGVTIDFTLKPLGPIIVRTQRSNLEPGIADVTFQRTRQGGRETVFLAGSGLKGVVRAHCERLLRTHGLHVCDPTRPNERNACGCRDHREGRNRPGADLGGQCPACFTFGSLNMAGRFRIGDALPTVDGFEAANRTEVRTGVGISRKNGSAVQGVLYDSEVVVDGKFGVRLSGENFSLWQVGLIGQALQDLDAGFYQIGGCKSRGMGTVRLDDWSVSFRFLDREIGKLRGVGNRGKNRRTYHLPDCDEMDCGNAAEEENRGFFRMVKYRGVAVDDLFNRLTRKALTEFLEARRK